MERLKVHTLQEVKVQATEGEGSKFNTNKYMFCAQSVSNPVGFKRARLMHYDSQETPSLERGAIGSI
jgi:hypothetical protein